MRIGLAIITLSFLTFSACTKGGDSASDTDVTSDFVNKLGGHTYTIGDSTGVSEDTEITVLQDTGNLIIENLGADCPFTETAILNHVMKSPDGQNYEIAYTDKNVNLLSGAGRDNCQDFIANYRARHIQQTQRKVACGYSTESVDFSCNGGRNRNWILKEERVGRFDRSDRSDRFDR